MTEMDVEKVDKNGVRWVTEGYLLASVAIAEDDERRAIMSWIEQQIKILDMNIETSVTSNKSPGSRGCR